ncbi:MAG: hypothetical protein JXA25_19320 [Anaerolineales bacterium]|nr:hypothetical protein [Anaerolineales bacterium]
MNRIRCIGVVIILASFISACASPEEELPYSANSSMYPTAIREPPSAATPLQNDQALDSFPLSEPGPYFAGKHEVSIIDESRSGREIKLVIWYPAIKQVGAAGSAVVQNAAPDMSDAPYPLILTGLNSGSYLYKSHLATYGFVTVIVLSPGFSYTAPWNNAVIDGPLDFLFALDVLTSTPPENLAGILDTNRVGAAGYSSDGFFSLALGGARIDPEYYFSQCANVPSLDPPLSPFFVDYFCNLSERWDEFSSQVGSEISTTSDGLWQPTTDDRIQAIMPMAPDSAWLYGDKGLAAINIPALIIAGTEDDLVSYEKASCYIYDHLVNSDRILISFIGKKHMMVENSEVIRRINHFTVAFFGYHLQGQKEYADYFSEDYIMQFDDLFWGVYPNE